MTEPIRIAQILNRMDTGGIESVVMNYYRHIDRSRVQFDFFLCEESSFPQRAELERLGAGIYMLPPYTKVLAYQRALQRALRERGYSIVHSHLSTMSVFPLFAAWRAGVPVRICHNHSTANLSEGKKSLLKYLLRPTSRIFATELFACGEKAGRWMYGDRLFEAGKVYVMPNAVEAARFAYDAQARMRLREELGIAQDAFVMGHVGRFIYVKNHPFLLQVFSGLLEQRPDARLLLVGEGELMEDVRQQAEHLGIAKQVIFTGLRGDADKLYSAMDVFCLPSFYEGMPVVTLEAQANGLPCVCSAIVSAEVERYGVHRLPIGEQHLPEWVQACLRACRVQPPQPGGMEDIRAASAALQAFYLSKAGVKETLNENRAF